MHAHRLRQGLLQTITSRRARTLAYRTGKQYPGSEPSFLSHMCFQRPYVCSTCNKSYLRETHLQAHSRSHLPDSEKPLACPEPNCVKRFWTSQHLRVHRDWHNGTKSFQVCNYFYVPRTSVNGSSGYISVRRQTVRKHLRSITSFGRMHVPRTHLLELSPINANMPDVQNLSPLSNTCVPTLRFTTVREIPVIRVSI